MQSLDSSDYEKYFVHRDLSMNEPKDQGIASVRASWG